jgi:glycosyltransferase involved in cell wall biosynthesis
VWTVALYAAMTGARFVVDAHSDAFQRTRWTRPRWLNRLVARRAVATLVTDPHWARHLERSRAPVMVVPDIPQPAVDASDDGIDVLGPGFHVMVVNTWSPDEPLADVVEAAAGLGEVTFHITGRRDGRVDALRPLPPNVRFTDFLADDDYRRLMRSVHGVVCLTTRDHTMQRGACEALSAGRPIITSRWPLLESYFSAGTVHVNNTSGEIRDGIVRLMTHYGEYADAISALQRERRDEWFARRAALIKLVSTPAALAAAPSRGGSR